MKVKLCIQAAKPYVSLFPNHPVQQSSCGGTVGCTTLGWNVAVCTQRTALYCTVQSRIVPHCTSLYWTALKNTELKCSALQRTYLHYCIIFQSTSLKYSAFQWTFQICTELHSFPLPWNALYLTAQWWSWWLEGYQEGNQCATTYHHRRLCWILAILQQLKTVALVSDLKLAFFIFRRQKKTVFLNTHCYQCILSNIVIIASGTPILWLAQH